eukprot:m.16319 g.16319  ORF g.16319 m.16319 type:complete len:464 (+) comp26849_c0_seq2:107-1498(+)
MALPEEVTVIVCGARNVKGRKKGPVNLSVVFGIGKQKFKTSSSQSENPVWNEESMFEIHGSDPLKFKIRDRDETIGKVTLPLSQIPAQKSSRPRWTPFQASHSSWRSTDAVQGELSFNAWVSKGSTAVVDIHAALKAKRSSNSPRPSPPPSKKTSDLFADPSVIESAFGRTQTQNGGRGRRGSSPALGGQSNLSMSTGDLKENGSRSLHVRGHVSHGSMGDVSGGRGHAKRPSVSSLVDAKGASSARRRPTEPSSSPQPPPPSDSHRRSRTSSVGSQSSSVGPPEVTGIAPRSGPLKGGTRITLRGSNLGQNAEDVVGLSVCGVDCLATLEYSSPAKVFCTTFRGKEAGSGPVILKTRSSGKGTSLITFTYKEHDYDPDEIPSDTSGKSHSLAPAPPSPFQRPKKDSQKREKVSTREMELSGKIDGLRQHVKDLEEENKDLKKYVDDLLSRIMEKNPELLMHH